MVFVLELDRKGANNRADLNPEELNDKEEVDLKLHCEGQANGDGTIGV